MSPPTGPDSAVIQALVEVRAAVRAVAFPFDLPGAPAARADAASLVTQLDDYVLPRLRRLDAPILAVVGGSTGAGKSTLVNSLVRAPVSPAGVLRPTTRAPVLVCHPEDLPWFADQSLLPRFVRTGGADRRNLQVINAPALAPGIALLDAPDIDSVVAANRSLARELLAAADVWLFVTTAARYADAIPWDVLREGRGRGTAVAVVLDRVPPGGRDDIVGHFDQMLAAEGLGGVPFFVLSESTLDSQGMLSELEVAPIARWMSGLSRDGSGGPGVVRRTLLGAVAAVGPRVEGLARAAEEQIRAVSGLAGAVRRSYNTAWSEVGAHIRGGAVLRGEVYTRWREMVVNGDLRQALRTVSGPHRSQVGAALADRPVPGRRFVEAVTLVLAGIVLDANVVAAQRCRDEWLAQPAGAALLAGDPALGHPWPGFSDAAHDVVAGWQRWLRSVVRAEAPRLRTRTRSYVTAATMLLAMVSAVAPPPDQITAAGAEPAMLRAVAESTAIHDLGARARDELLARIGELLAAEVERRLAAVGAAGVAEDGATRLREWAAALGRAWVDIVAATGGAG
jgi:hypothetical protein